MLQGQDVMDGSQFDELTKDLTIPSRRGIVAAAGASVLAALATLVRPGASIGAKRKKKRKGTGQNSPGPAGPAGAQGPQGPAGPVQIAYAHVNPDGTFHHAKGVVGINTVDRAPANPGEPTRRDYCFKLEFTPSVAAASALIANDAVVTTAMSYDTIISSVCPEGYRDAVARVYGANTSVIQSDVFFKIIFF